MLRLDINISVGNKDNLDKVIEVIKLNGFEGLLFVVEHQEFYEISYETNDYFERIDYVLEHAFPQYHSTEHLNVGSAIIHMIIEITQSSSSTDDWGRALNSDTIRTITYFLNPPEKLPCPAKTKLLALTSSEKREYDIFITAVRQIDSERAGYIVTKVPFQEKAVPDFIVNKLFATGDKAFAEGVFMMKSTLEKEYEEEKMKRKSKKKRSK